MTYSLTELNALCRLHMFHLNEVYTVKEMRSKIASERVVIFDTDEIHAEVEANDLANDLG